METERWYRRLARHGLPRLALQALLIYLVSTLLALALVLSISTPDTYRQLELVYGLAMLFVTMALFAWLVTHYAAQAASAVENTRLVEAERRQRELAEALRESAEALNSTLNSEDVLDQILATVTRLVPNDAACIIALEGQVGRVIRWNGYVASGQEEALRQMVLPIAQLKDFRRIIETGEPSVTGDTYGDPDWVRFPASAWIRSHVGVPIRAKGHTLGMLAVDSLTPNFYTLEHARRLMAFTAQAAIALENAQLFEQAQQRVRELVLLYDSSLAITSTLDKSAVLHSVTERMARAVEATSTYIVQCDWENDTGTIIAEYFSPQANDQERLSDLGETHSLSDYPRTLAALQTQRHSITQLSRTDADPAAIETLLRYGGKSSLRVPLTTASQTLGYVVIWDSRLERAWTNSEIRVCQTLANQAAIAFENARLFEAERKQLRLAQTLQAVGALLTAGMSLDEVFNYIFDLLGRVVHYDSVSIQLLSDNQVVFAAGRGFSDVRRAHEFIRGSLPSMEERWGQPHQRVMVISDTEHDPRWFTPPGSEPIRSWVGAALRAKGRLLGILNVDSFLPDAYNEATGETVAAFANQAAIAIENAQLHDSVRRHAEELEDRIADRTLELERERKRTAAILDAAGEGIMFTNLKGSIEYVNAAMERLTGFTASEVLGQNPRLWQSGTTPVSFYQKMWQTISRGGIWQGELVNRRKDGTLYDAALTIAPVFDLKGEIGGYVGVQRDISNQKELDRLKDEFVSNVSHELRTPIANVKLYISLLTRGKPEKYDEYLQTLRREAARLEKLIEDLLDLSRLDLGRQPMLLAAVDVNQLAAQLIADRAALAASRQLLIDYRGESWPALAQADPAMLSQVVSNLLTNAVNYTPAGGLITVTTAARWREEQTWITITIQDTGPGISSHDHAHIFERFYRGEAGRKSGAPGTGLGLAISAQIMNKLGGSITLDSQPGAGAAFTVWLKPAA